MKHIQSFIDKIEDLEKTKLYLQRLSSELRVDGNEIVSLIVNILDEITDKNIKICNIDIISNNMKFYKIVHKKKSDTYQTHFGGLDTIIYWKDGNNKINQSSLWNFNTSQDYYKQIADILDGLIKKYKNAYNNVLIKRISTKFNI